MTASPGELLTYQTVLLQFRPVVSSEERVNVAVLLYCSSIGRLSWRTSHRYSRLGALFPDLRGAAYRAMLRQVERGLSSIVGPSNQAQGNLFLTIRPMGSDGSAFEDILRRALPAGNSNFTWSSVRTGICEDLDARANELFSEYIGRFEQPRGRERMDDAAIWEEVRRSTKFRSVAGYLEIGVTLATSDYEYTFTAGWQNGKRQVVEPISFDYADPRDMLEEANRWRGRLSELSRSNDFALTVILSEAPPAPSVFEKYEQAKSMLKRSDSLRSVFTPSQVPELADLIEGDINPR